MAIKACNHDYKETGRRQVAGRWYKFMECLYCDAWYEEVA